MSEIDPSLRRDGRIGSSQLLRIVHKSSTPDVSCARTDVAAEPSGATLGAGIVLLDVSTRMDAGFEDTAVEKSAYDALLGMYGLACGSAQCTTRYRSQTPSGFARRHDFSSHVVLMVRVVCMLCEEEGESQTFFAVIILAVVDFELDVRRVGVTAIALQAVTTCFV